MAIDNRARDFYTKKYLPSKKILIAIGVVALGGILYFAVPRIIEYYQTHRAAFSITGKPPAPLIASGGETSNFDKDTDGDGIPDWQEILFNLDPNKKDSNGDGVPDALPTAGGKSIGDFVDIPEIDKLTLAVYNKFQTTPTNSITPDQVQAATSDEILAQAQSVEDGLKKYTMVDLDLTDSDKTHILAYQQSIDALVASVPDGAIFAKNIQEKILKGDISAASEIAFLNQTVTKLLVMPVPAHIADFHLKFINGVYYILQVLQMPYTGDELNAYTLSLVAQKNINLISQTAGDIDNIANVYRTND